MENLRENNDEPRKAKEKRMETIARSDPLTGVLNRRGFERDAANRLRDSADDATGALLFIDLNDFKLINDEYGHEIGDQLLTIADGEIRKLSSNTAKPKSTFPPVGPKNCLKCDDGTSMRIASIAGTGISMNSY